MVSYDKLNVTKIYLFKVTTKFHLIIFICRSLQKYLNYVIWHLRWYHMTKSTSLKFLSWKVTPNPVYSSWCVVLFGRYLKYVMWHPRWCQMTKFVISKFFPAKSNPSSCVFIFICHSIQKIPKMCNLTPKMVSRDIKFMTKIFLLKSYHKSCVFIFICRSIQNIPKMCNLTPKMVSRDTKFMTKKFPFKNNPIKKIWKHLPRRISGNRQFTVLIANYRWSPEKKKKILHFEFG